MEEVDCAPHHSLRRSNIMPTAHIRMLAGAVREAQEDGPLVVGRHLSGFSGARLIGALQRLASAQAGSGLGNYAEIGVFQGLTLISTALAIPGARAFGVDNFSQFDRHGMNRAIVLERVAANGLTNVVLIDRDYENAFGQWDGGVIGTLFVDGPHDYRSTLMQLLLALPFLSESGVIVIDDANYRHVRLAIRDFLVTHPEWGLLFEAYTPCHPNNMTAAQLAAARDGWWNGVTILVHDPQRTLDREAPPTLPDRTLLVQDHEVHASRYAVDAPALLTAWSCFRSGQFARAAKAATRLIRSKDRSLLGGHATLNTFSDGLTKGRFNSNL
jgi:hypothetical protein